MLTKYSIPEYSMPAAYRYIVINPATGYQHMIGIGETDMIAVPLPRVAGAEAEFCDAINRKFRSRDDFEACLDSLGARWTRQI